MNKNIFIDTNIYSDLMRGNTETLAVLSQANTVLVSIFVLGELLAGFRAGTRETENRNILRDFLAEKSVETVEATSRTAEYFAQIQHYLRGQGTPIPINDVWIAAHSMEHEARLYTLDKHFQNIPGLELHI